MALPFFAFAQEEAGETPATPSPGYFQYFIGQMTDYSEAYESLWGRQTRRLPKGFFALDFLMGTTRADTRFDENGNIATLGETFDLPGEKGEYALFGSLEAKAEKHVVQYVFQGNYGLTGKIDLFWGIPFLHQESWLKFDFDPGSSVLMGVRTEEELFELFKLLGRPTPTTHYKSDVIEPGDFYFGSTWNYFRNRNVSLAAQGQMFFPTGKTANPNEALIFGLGPQFDTGENAFAPHLRHVSEFTMPTVARFLVIGIGLDYGYYPKSQFPSPTFFKPSPEIYGRMIDQGFDSTLFADLSGIGDTYDLTSGSRFRGDVTVGVELKYVELAVGYDYTWKQKPKFESDSQAFEDYMGRLGVFNESQLHSLSAQVAVLLHHFYIPLEIELNTRFPIYGVSAAYERDTLTGQVRILIPF